MLVLLCVLCANSIFAKKIDEVIAKKVAVNFLVQKKELNFSIDIDKISLYYVEFDRNKNNLFYIFNFGEKAFTIVSADDNAFPILAYSDEGAFNVSKISPATKEWIENYRDQLSYIINKKIINKDVKISDQWEALISNNVLRVEERSTRPLISTKWGQGDYYNSLCPSNTVVGCVATAMTQIMKYWGYPAYGIGSFSYYDSRYEFLAANFGNTKYEWSLMPTSVYSPNYHVALLMYHCGVSVKMNYGTTSSAYVISSDNYYCAENALKTFFGYKNTLSGIKRRNFTETVWKNTLKNELDSKRSIIYSGYGPLGGHAFVCDGYINDYFHFNWGWDGENDGYYLINSLVGGFNNEQRAVIGIKTDCGYNALKISNRVISGDFNRDGFENDVAAFYDYGNNNTKLHVWNSDGNNFIYQGDNWKWSSSQYNDPRLIRVVSGDFNRDGFNDDIAGFYDYGNFQNGNTHMDIQWE